MEQTKELFKIECIKIAKIVANSKKITLRHWKKIFSRFASLILTATILSPFGAIQAEDKSNSLYSPKKTSIKGILISFDLDYEARCHEISKEIRKNNKEAENFDE